MARSMRVSPFYKRNRIRDTMVADICDLVGLEGDAHKKVEIAHLIVRTILQTIVKAVRKGEKVKISGFGTFHRMRFPSHRRDKRNFAKGTHAMRQMRAKYYARFTPLPPLKRFVAQGFSDLSESTYK